MPTLRTIADVLRLIDPVDPENLRWVGGGVYEARWCPPVPLMEVEVLRRTPGVALESQPFELAELPGWLAVRFRLTSDVEG